MGSSKNTNTFGLDFGAIEFPLPISDNVKRFFYPEFMSLNPDKIIEYDQFCDILNGKDKSENANLVLHRLLDPRYNRLPPRSFDIIEDNIIQKKAIDYHTHKLYISGEQHQGVCTLEGVSFEFEYYLDFHNSYWILKDGTINGHKIFRNRSIINLQGDSRKYSDTYMHKACQEYFLHKSYNFDEELILEKKKEEEYKWNKAISEHKLELIDYLKSQSWKCDKVNWRIEKGFIKYEEFRYLEYGICRLGNGCPNRCLVKKGMINDYGEHDDFWFKIGLDKLDLKFLR